MPPSWRRFGSYAGSQAGGYREQVREQAAADPQPKQRFLDDPNAAAVEFAEGQTLREMYESGALFRRNCRTS